MTVNQSPFGGQVPHDLVELGHVMSAFGVRGWIKVRPYTEGFDTLVQAKQWWLKAPESVLEQGAATFISLSIAQARPHSNTVIALPEGYHDRDQAEALRGHTVWLPRAEFAPLPDDEYYWVDLLGCHVYGVAEDASDAGLTQNNDAPQVFMGQVSHVFDNGAHAVLVVDRGELQEGQFSPLRDKKNRIQQALVPFVEAHVMRVDLDNKSIITDWPVAF